MLCHLSDFLAKIAMYRPKPLTAEQIASINVCRDLHSCLPHFLCTLPKSLFLNLLVLESFLTIVCLAHRRAAAPLHSTRRRRRQKLARVARARSEWTVCTWQCGGNLPFSDIFPNRSLESTNVILNNSTLANKSHSFHSKLITIRISTRPPRWYSLHDVRTAHRAYCPRRAASHSARCPAAAQSSAPTPWSGDSTPT